MELPKPPIQSTNCQLPTDWFGARCFGGAPTLKHQASNPQTEQFFGIPHIGRGTCHKKTVASIETIATFGGSHPKNKNNKLFVGKTCVYIYIYIS